MYSSKPRNRVLTEIATVCNGIFIWSKFWSLKCYSFLSFWVLSYKSRKSSFLFFLPSSSKTASGFGTWAWVELHLSRGGVASEHGWSCTWAWVELHLSTGGVASEHGWSCTWAWVELHLSTGGIAPEHGWSCICANPKSRSSPIFFRRYVFKRLRQLNERSADAVAKGKVANVSCKVWIFG